MIAPGIHLDMPNGDYHADTDYLSSSALKRLLPEHYKPYNGNGDALDFGTAFHAQALGTDENVTTHDFPTWLSKAAKEARDAARAAGEVPILTADAERIEQMVASLRRHESATRLLTQPGATPEVSAFTHDDNGNGIKARFDLSAPVIVDLKSTSGMPGEHELARTVINYGYDLSAAHYLDVAERVGLEPQGFALVFVEKTAPFRVTVAELDAEFLARGARLVELAKDRHHGRAPSYPGETGFLTLNCPRWAS